jgi:alpha-L-rhamnosidase
MKFFSPCTLCFLAFFILFVNKIAAQSIAPIKLECEHLAQPIGVDQIRPRLSWMIQDNRKGAKQTAYSIVIGIDSALVNKGIGKSWSTGKVNSSRALIVYNGEPLKPFTKYFWQVSVWDKDGKSISGKAISSFETGMMDKTNWKGAWISDGNTIQTLPAPYFRKQFNIRKKIRTARAYIAAAGLYELYLNGKKVGNHRLDPMYTRFDRRNLYISYDITPYLSNSGNAVGVLLGNGWYNHQSIAVWNFDKAPWRARPAFCLDIRITYEDNSTEVISSGSDWKSNPSPIIFNSIYTAEHYDARLEQPNWNTVNFDDSKWKGVRLRAAPSPHIVSQLMQPIRNVEEIAVKTMRKINDTTYLFDLGRNIAGVTKIKFKGTNGMIVRVKHGERLSANGRLDLSNIDVYHRPVNGNDPFQTDLITCADAEVEFMPKFNYKGFQYVEVTSSKPLVLNEKSIVAYFMHSDVAATGSISSSNPLIDKLWWATNNSYLSNLMGLPTDCPQREKNGWTGDGHFAIETGLYNFDSITIYEKWLADHRDEQQPNGVLPDIIPTGGWGYGTENGTDWTSTIAIIPWTIYQFYGDSKALVDNYQNIRSYVRYVENISPNYLTKFGRGDWVPVKSKSDLEYTSSIYYYVDADILAKTAKLLDKKEDALYFSKLAENIKTSINAKYFNATTSMYGSGLQTELSMALLWKIVPKGYELKVAANLAKRVADDGMHLDVGVLGARAILSALSDNGQAETAYKLAVQDTYPSWGWWIVNGATTLYENWDINAPRDISLNHMMFGEIGGWFFRGLAGIQIDEDQPGFKHVLLKPNFVGGLTHFSGNHLGPYGNISSAWKREGKTITYQVIVPANSTATIYFPIVKGQNVYEDGKLLKAMIKVEAGSYAYEIR